MYNCFHIIFGRVKIKIQKYGSLSQVDLTTNPNQFSELLLSFY